MHLNERDKVEGGLSFACPPATAKALKQTPLPWLLLSADAASEEATAPSTAGTQTAGWFLLAFVRSEQTRETLPRILPKAWESSLPGNSFLKAPRDDVKGLFQTTFPSQAPCLPVTQGKVTACQPGR